MFCHKSLLMTNKLYMWNVWLKMHWAWHFTVSSCLFPIDILTQKIIPLLCSPKNISNMCSVQPLFQKWLQTFFVVGRNWESINKNIKDDWLWRGESMNPSLWEPNWFGPSSSRFLVISLTNIQSLMTLYLTSVIMVKLNSGNGFWKVFVKNYTANKTVNVYSKHT